MSVDIRVANKKRRNVIMHYLIRFSLSFNIAGLGVSWLTFYSPCARAELPMVEVRETRAVRERLEVNVAQLLHALADLGSPLADEDRVKLGATGRLPDEEAIGTIQE